jgi:hypothetical protein
MKIYAEGSEPLHEILKSASSEQGATLLVPDLQRPYVWSPSQVTLLVDSLLRGWPFGTLLLWSVHKDELAGIPSRPFWRVVDRTGEFEDQQVGKSNPPAQFRMVLDGQQRLQSLLLAFGGDAWGFRLLDQEWSTILDAERPKGKNAKKHWSLGHLCLDINAFYQRTRDCGDIESVDFRDVLSWVVQSPMEGRSPWLRPNNYKFPISSAFEDGNQGRYVRLSRFWDLAPTQQKPTEKIFRAKLEPILVEHDVPRDVINGVLGALAELMIKIVDIKQANVSFLQLSPFESSAGGSQDVYNDAIVNIFTRLNTAGRALTRQEITFAWIKNGWGDGSKTANRSAGSCFEDLQTSLAEAGVTLDIDSLVGMVSAMWSVLHRDGALLTASDLLRGEKVRPMAQDLVQSWDVVSANVVDGARLVRERGFNFGTHYRSLNVLNLLLAWRLIGRTWFSARTLPVVQRDAFEKSLDAVFRECCDRWILMSQWSGRWGKSTDKAFAEYVRDLSADFSVITSLSNPKEVIALLKERMDTWISTLQVDSSKYIDDLAVLTRNRVHDYYLPLWLWHRLNEERWKASALPLREAKRGALSHDVDHIVAIKLWDTLQGAHVESDAQDDLALSHDDLSTAMNALGNCCLLEKSFNIAKGAEPMRSFLGRVYEFQTSELTIDEWSRDIGIDLILIEPTGQTAADVRDVVERRTIAMKTELKEYLAGTRQRADV